MSFKSAGFCLIILLFHLFGYSQNLEIEWEKQLISRSPDFFTDLIENSNKEFIIIGSMRPEGKRDQDFWLVKFSVDGEILWSNSFGSAFNDYPFSFAQFNNGAYILVGKSITPDNLKHSFLVKADGDGKEIWQKTLDEKFDNELQNVITLEDETFIVSGTKKTDENSENIWLAKFSETGEILWEKTFGDKLKARAESMKKLPDGGFVLAARVSPNGNQDSDLWLFRFDSKGEKIWDNKVESPGINVWPECVCCSPDENIMVVGWYGTCMNDITDENPIFDYDLFLAKISPEGKIIWTKNIDSEGSEGGNAITVRADGKILLAGKKETSFLGRVGSWVLLADQDGTILNELVIPNNFHNDKVAAIINSSDGGFVIIGPGETDTEQTNSNGWIKKFKAF